MKNEIKQYYEYLIYTDFFRFAGRAITFKDRMFIFLGMRYSGEVRIPYFYRTARMYSELYASMLHKGSGGGVLQKLKQILYKIQRKFFFLIYEHLQIKYSISFSTSINAGPGLRIYHTLGVIVSGNCELGQNCAIWQGVTLGNDLRKRNGVPKVGDWANICSGAKVVGGVSIGKNVTIGANAVVVKDIEDNMIVVGVPAIAIKQKDKDDHEGRFFNYMTYDEWEDLHVSNR